MADQIAQEAVRACQDAYATGQRPAREVERAAVKSLLADLVARAPGNSVEVRVPPYAAVQVIEGIRHRRGNPPATVECDARTLIELAIGALTWEDAVGSARLSASGERSDLSRLLPLL